MLLIKINRAIIQKNQQRRGSYAAKEQMAKTAEFHTLLRNYRGIVGNMRIGGVWISFDSCFFNYFGDDDEIQFNLAGQDGIVTIPTVESYEKIPEDELLEDAFAGYEAVLKGGNILTVHCFNPKNKG